MDKINIIKKKFEEITTLHELITDKLEDLDEILEELEDNKHKRKYDSREEGKQSKKEWLSKEEWIKKKKLETKENEEDALVLNKERHPEDEDEDEDEEEPLNLPISTPTKPEEEHRFRTKVDQSIIQKNIDTLKKKPIKFFIKEKEEKESEKPIMKVIGGK